MSDYPEYPPQRSRNQRLTVGDATFIVTSNVNGNMRWIREVHHVRRHRKGGSADVCIYPNGGRKPSATLASLWSHLGVDPDARWKECAADHPAFPANRSIRTAMDAYDDARKNAAAAAVLTAAGWTWVNDGAAHWEEPPAQAVDLERARNEGHDGAIRYVLGYLFGMGDWGSTQYVEILNGCGRESIIRSAIEDGELEFTGLGRWVAERGTDEERALIHSKAMSDG